MEKEGCFTVLGAIAAIVSAFIAFQQGCLHYPQFQSSSPSSPVEETTPSASQSSPRTEEVGPQPSPRQEQDHDTADGGKPAGSADRQEFRPLEFSLSNGEQTEFLSGGASVGVEFNRVGEVDFVTVRINSPGKQPESHAVLGTGDRFDLTAGDNEYYVYILSVDQEARRVKLKIDKKE